MPAWGSVLLSSFVFLNSFGNVGQLRASKTQVVININVVGHLVITAKTVGRKTLLKYTSISVVTILFCLTVVLLTFGQDTDVPLTLGRVLETYRNEFVENVDFVAIQTILTLVAIWYVGGLCGQLIIEKGKNKFIIGGLTFLLMWILLFITSAVTGGIMNSINYGLDGFTSAVLSWTVYGLIPFFVFGLIHGLTTGFFLGQEIKKRGERLKALQVPISLLTSFF